jgi:hypothetical protein
MPGRATSMWPSTVASARPRSPSSGRGNGPAGLPLAPAAPRRTRTTPNGACASISQTALDHTAVRSPGSTSAIAIQRWGWTMNHLDHDLFCVRPRGKRRSVHRTMPTSKRKTLIPREIRHYLRLRPETGQQDLDERSKHLTERGPFVNGARSNLAAAHGRGRSTRRVHPSTSL